MNVYSDEEVSRIKKTKDTNNLLEEFFQNKRSEWDKMLSPLFESIRIEMNRDNSNRILECQALCLSYRQTISNQISVFLDKRSKQEVKIKGLRQDKFIFYATGFGLKTNLGEKAMLIDAHVAEEQRNIELIENYIEYLRDCKKQLESFQYTVKNIIDLFTLLSK